MSFLSAVGHGLKVFFTGADHVAQIAEPFVDLAFPGIAPLFNLVVGEVGKAEGLAIAAGVQNGSGAQKLALVVAAVTEEYLSFAKANSLPSEPADVSKFVNAVVALLNSIPEPTTPA
jgi:hypothetical protein